MDSDWNARKHTRGEELPRQEEIQQVANIVSKEERVTNEPQKRQTGVGSEGPQRPEWGEGVSLGDMESFQSI